MAYVGTLTVAQLREMIERAPVVYNRVIAGSEAPLTRESHLPNIENLVFADCVFQGYWGGRFRNCIFKGVKFDILVNQIELYFEECIFDSGCTFPSAAKPRIDMRDCSASYDDEPLEELEIELNNPIFDHSPAGETGDDDETPERDYKTYLVKTVRYLKFGNNQHQYVYNVDEHTNIVGYTGDKLRSGGFSEEAINRLKQTGRFDVPEGMFLWVHAAYIYGETPEKNKWEIHYIEYTNLPF